MEENKREIGMTKLIIDEDKEKKQNSDKIIVEQEFLIPTNKILEIPLEKDNFSQTKIKEEPAEIRLNKFIRKEPKKEYLFAPSKLLDENEDIKSESDEYLFKPAELICEEPLELFNKEAEKIISQYPLKILSCKEEENKNKENKKEQEKKDEVKEEESKNKVIENEETKSVKIKDEIKTEEIKNEESQNKKIQKEEIKLEEIKDEEVKKEEVKKEEVKKEEVKKEEVKKEEIKK